MSPSRTSSLAATACGMSRYPLCRAKRVTSLTLLTLLILFLLGNTAIGQDTSLLTRSSFISGYSYRTKIIIDESVVPGFTNLSNFPYLIDITDDDLRSVANGGKVYRNDGFDLAFALDDGTVLDYERETYDPATGELRVWVKLPTLYASQDTEIFLYYGNCGGSVPDPSTDIWDGNFLGLYHLDNAGGGVNDDSGNGYDLTNNGTNATAAVVGRGLRFNASDYLAFDNNVDIINDASTITLSAWIEPTSVLGDQVIMSFSIGGAPSNNPRLTLRLENNALVAGGATQDSPLDFYSKKQLVGSIPANTWTHVLAQVDYKLKDVKLFVNGDEVLGLGTLSWANIQTPSTNSANSALGAEASGSGNHFGGAMDEVRIYDGLKSAEWIKAEYNNQMSSAYVSLDVEESEFHWLGNSTDWSSTTNWGGCIVPDAATTVVIPNTANDPILVSDVTVRDLIIETDAAFATFAKLNLTGNLFNDGTIIATLGTIEFSGNATQDFVGNSFQPGNLTINKTGGSARIYNEITMPAASTLTLMSGLLELAGHGLDLRGNLVGGDNNSYIVATSDYCLNRPVAASDVLFPLGSTTGYSPATLNNAGTADDFCIRTLEEVRDGGETGTALSTDALGKTWLIDEVTPGGADVDVTLQWRATDELPGFDQGSAFVSHHNGSWWEQMNSSAVNDLGGNSYSITASSIKDFSPFSVGSSSSVLPVEWVGFDVRVQNEAVLLSWETATEIDNDFFTVERSADGKEFDPIGKVQGFGNSNVRRTYRFTDHQPMDGRSYYRLRQTDYDGDFSYSRVASVTTGFDARTRLSIFPTVNDGMNFRWSLQGAIPRKDVEMVLYDLQGKTILRRVLESDAQGSVEGAGFTDWKLDEGIYILRLDDGAQVAAERMIVN